MTESAKTEWGCVAIGRSGDVAIDVDQALSGPERWEMQIDLPRFHLRFAIPAPTVVAQFGDFLQCHLSRPTTGELPLGTLANANVAVVKDDEFLDRFFLRVLAHDGGVWHTLSSDEVSHSIAALEQANSDLEG